MPYWNFGLDSTGKTCIRDMMSTSGMPLNIGGLFWHLHTKLQVCFVMYTWCWSCMHVCNICKYIANMSTRFTQHFVIHLSVKARMFSTLSVCNVSKALPSGKCAGLPRLLAKESLHRVWSQPVDTLGTHPSWIQLFCPLAAYLLIQQLNFERAGMTACQNIHYHTQWLWVCGCCVSGGGLFRYLWQLVV